MREDYIRWNTPYLGGRVFERLVCGHAGVPVILFPTSQPGHPPRRPFSRLLDAKGITHWLDVRRRAKHDWPPWWDMFPRYLSKL